MLNNAIIMGRLTADPTLKKTNNGTSVVSFTLAVERDFASRDTSEKETDFINVVAWRGTAEFVEKYFTKGRMAVVSGRVQTRKWQDNDGNNRYATEIVADSVYFGDSKRSEGNNTTPEQSATRGTTGGIKEIEDDGDLPF